MVKTSGLFGKGKGKGKKNAAAPVSKTFAKNVLKVLEKKAERKYISNPSALMPTSGSIGSISVPVDLVPCIPKLGQGTQSNQRVGQKVSNAHGRVDFQFFLISNGAGAYPTQDTIVRVYMLNSVAAKSYGQVSLLPNNTLLDNGDQTTQDWPAGTAGNYYGIASSQQPLSHEDWRGSHKEIRLIKNQGVPNGDITPGQAPNTFGHPANRLSMTWKHKGNLLYDDVAGAGPSNPTNYAPVFAVVAYNPDNTLFNGQIQYVYRTHYWFEDI